MNRTAGGLSTNSAGTCINKKSGGLFRQVAGLQGCKLSGPASAGIVRQRTSFRLVFVVCFSLVLSFAQAKETNKKNSNDSLTLHELLPPGFVMTSGQLSQQVPLPQQGCETVTVSGDFTSPSSYIDNINTTHRHEYGIYFGGITPAVFRGNTMYDHYAGLYLNNVAVIDTQTHAGNRWPGSYGSGYGAVNMNDTTSQNLLSSLFTTNQTVASHNPKIPLNNALPPFFVNDQGWFAPFPSGSIFSCSGSSYCNAAMVGGGDNDTRSRIAQDDEITTEFIPESKMMAKQQLYDELKSDNILLLTDTTYQIFLFNNLNTSIGKLQEVAAIYAELKNTSTSLAANLHYTDSILTLYADSLLILDSIHAAGALQDYQIRRINLVEQLNAYQIQLKQFFEEQIQNDSVALAIIVQLNNAITPSEQPDENEKFINKMTALYYNKNKTALTSNINQIEAIAQQCPYSGGVAVYQARALIRLLNDSIEYNDAETCFQSGYYRQQLNNQTAEKKTQPVKVIPNPARDEITVKLIDGKEKICRITVADVLSNEILNLKLNCTESQIQINLQYVPSAVYTLRIIRSDCMMETIKLVVIK